MNCQTYDTFEDAVAAAVRTVGAKVELDSRLLQELVKREDIVGRMQHAPAGDALGHEAHLKIVRYVVRDDLLYSFENFIDLLKNALNFSIGLAAILSREGVPSGVKSIVDAVHGLAGMSRRVTAQGFRLTPQEFAVVAALRERGQASIEQLCQDLIGMDAGSTEKALAAYEQTENRKAGFTKRIDDRTWTLVGF